MKKIVCEPDIKAKKSTITLRGIRTAAKQDKNDVEIPLYERMRVNDGMEGRASVVRARKESVVLLSERSSEPSPGGITRWS